MSRLRAPPPPLLRPRPDQAATRRWSAFLGFCAGAAAGLVGGVVLMVALAPVDRPASEAGPPSALHRAADADSVLAEARGPGEAGTGARIPQAGPSAALGRADPAEAGPASVAAPRLAAPDRPASPSPAPLADAPAPGAGIAGREAPPATDPRRAAPAIPPPAAPPLVRPPPPRPGAARVPRIVVHYRDGSAAGAEAARAVLAAMSQRDGAAGAPQAELRAVAAVPSQRVVRYFRAEDAAAAARLAGQLGRGWAVQDFGAYEPAPVTPLLEVWLPDRG